MTYREFMKRHRIPSEEILSLLWDTGDEWRAAVGSISPGRRHMFLETVHLGAKAAEVDSKLKLEDLGHPKYENVDFTEEFACLRDAWQKISRSIAGAPKVTV